MPCAFSGIQHLAKDRKIDRLDKVVIETCLHGELAMRVVAKRSDGDEKRVFAKIVLANLPGYMIPVQLGHREVNEHHIGLASGMLPRWRLCPRKIE